MSQIRTQLSFRKLFIVTISSFIFASLRAPVIPQQLIGAAKNLCALFQENDLFNIETISGADEAEDQALRLIVSADGLRNSLLEPAVVGLNEYLMESFEQEDLLKSLHGICSWNPALKQCEGFDNLICQKLINILGHDIRAAYNFAAIIECAHDHLKTFVQSINSDGAVERGQEDSMHAACIIKLWYVCDKITKFFPEEDGIGYNAEPAFVAPFGFCKMPSLKDCKAIKLSGETTYVGRYAQPRARAGCLPTSRQAHSDVMFIANIKHFLLNSPFNSYSCHFAKHHEEAGRVLYVLGKDQESVKLLVKNTQKDQPDCIIDTEVVGGNGQNIIVDLSADATKIVLGHQNSIKIFDAATSHCINKFDVDKFDEKDDEVVVGVKFAPNGEFVIVVTQLIREKTLYTITGYNIIDGQVKLLVNNGKYGRFKTFDYRPPVVEYSPDMKFLVVGWNFGMTRILEASSGACHSLSDPVYGKIFSAFNDNMRRNKDRVAVHLKRLPKCAPFSVSVDSKYVACCKFCMQVICPIEDLLKMSFGHGNCFKLLPPERRNKISGLPQIDCEAIEIWNIENPGRAFRCAIINNGGKGFKKICAMQFMPDSEHLLIYYDDYGFSRQVGLGVWRWKEEKQIFDLSDGNLQNDLLFVPTTFCNKVLPGGPCCALVARNGGAFNLYARPTTA